MCRITMEYRSRKPRQPIVLQETSKEKWAAKTPATQSPQNQSSPVCDFCIPRKPTILHAKKGVSARRILLPAGYLTKGCAGAQRAQLSRVSQGAFATLRAGKSIGGQKPLTASL